MKNWTFTELERLSALAVTKGVFYAHARGALIALHGVPEN